jgi:hypothetical protein
MRAILTLLCFTLAGCPGEVIGRGDGGFRDTPSGLDAPRLDAPGLDAPELDAPELDVPGLDVPGLDAPVADAPPDPDVPSVPADAGPMCPPPGGMDCSPGPGMGTAEECYDWPSCFLTQVQRAVNDVVRDNPTWFDSSAGPTHVLQVEMYMDAVVALLNTRGLCSIRDPNAGDEIVVKLNNAYAENFDILTASEDVRSGAGIYTSQCAPAWF